MSITESNIHQRLQESGLKLTAQRLIIYKALYGTKIHPTAEQLYELINPEHPTISRGTVYKTLDTLVKNGLAKKVMTGDDVYRFDADTGSHAHLHCKKTGKVLDYHDTELENLLTEYFKRKQLSHFLINEIQLQINGEILSEKISIT